MFDISTRSGGPHRDLERQLCGQSQSHKHGASFKSQPCASLCSGPLPADRTPGRTWTPPMIDILWSNLPPRELTGCARTDCRVAVNCACFRPCLSRIRPTLRPASSRLGRSRAVVARIRPNLTRIRPTFRVSFVIRIGSDQFCRFWRGFGQLGVISVELGRTRPTLLDFRRVWPFDCASLRGVGQNLPNVGQLWSGFGQMCAISVEVGPNSAECGPGSTGRVAERTSDFNI